MRDTTWGSKTGLPSSRSHCPRGREQAFWDYDYVRATAYPCDECSFGVCAVVFLPVSVDSVGIHGHEHLTKLAARVEPGTLWRDQPFAESFPELDAATRHLGDAGIEDLLSHLREEMQSSGETVDALGVSVPARVVPVWGLPVMALTMLYFLMHLTRFNRVAGLGEEVWSFPWDRVLFAPVSAMRTGRLRCGISDGGGGVYVRK